jgi:hypothetical protein
MQQQLALQGSGSTLVDDARVFNAASDWIAAQQLRSPDRYLIDPSSEAGKAATKAKQESQAQAQQQQADMARASMLLEKYKVDVPALTDLIGHMVKAAVEEARLTLMPDPLDEIEAQAEVAARAAAEGAGEVGQLVTSQLPKPQTPGPRPNGASA